MAKIYNMMCDQALLEAHECYLTWQETGDAFWLNMARDYAYIAWDYMALAQEV